MNNEEMNGSLAVNEKAYRIVRLLGKGKGGYSYLAEQDGYPVVVKQIHHEPCDYYTFGNKIEAELRDYERLQKAGIRIPRMHAVDTDAERIVKDYIEGPTVMELLRSGTSVEPYLSQVRDMAAKAMAAGLNIDYYPTNFVVHDGLLWYVDYECNDYSEQWDFEHWGIQYWLPKVSLRFTIGGYKFYADGIQGRREVLIMNDYIAYCGLDCETCEARLATINNDNELRKKVSKEWSELNGVEITPEMINCSGCRIPGVKTVYCDSLCPIRLCAREKQLETCGSCPEMESCEKAGEIIANNPDARGRLENAGSV